MAFGLQAIVSGKPGARGLAVIVTNDYDKRPKNYPPLPCHKDGEEMRQTFEDTFGFARFWKKNATAEEIKQIAKELADIDYSDSYKFIVFAYSGHGEKGPLFVANDGETVDVNRDIIDLFEPYKVPKNKHITKLFFLDACRGDERMERAVAKGGELGNYLIGYSTMPDYVAWATSSGSVWTRLLAKKLREKKDSVQNILAEVREECKEKYLLQCPPTFDASDGVVRLYDEGELVLQKH